MVCVDVCVCVFSKWSSEIRERQTSLKFIFLVASNWNSTFLAAERSEDLRVSSPHRTQVPHQNDAPRPSMHPFILPTHTPAAIISSTLQKFIPFPTVFLRLNAIYFHTRPTRLHPATRRRILLSVSLSAHVAHFGVVERLFLWSSSGCFLLQVDTKRSVTYGSKINYLCGTFSVLSVECNTISLPSNAFLLVIFSNICTRPMNSH